MSSTTPGSEPERADEAAGAVDETVPSEQVPDSASPDESATADERVAEEPAPVESAPDESAPAEAASDDSTPAEAAPVETVPVEPTPVEPTPVEPTPVEIAPADTAQVDAPDAAAADEPARESEPAPAVEPEPAPDVSPLDEAVARANAGAVTTEDDGIDDGAGVAAPVAAGSVRRETYVPPSTVVAAGTAAGAATLAPEPEPLYVAPTPGPQTIYVQAPTPPKAKGNRGFGTLVALIGALLFALLYAAIGYLLLLGQPDPSAIFAQFLSRPVYWVPIVAFFLGFTLLVVIVNRGPWWCYAVFGLLVGVLVYFSYIGAALLTVEAWTLSLDAATAFVNERWLDPFAIVAGVIALEIPIWLGGWIAARGRAVTERNRLALEEYDRQLAAGPQPGSY